jgi:hypothetical protein
MKLASVYIVRDPSPRSTLADILFCLRVDAIENYIRGCRVGAWADEHHTVYTTEAEAETDARARMATQASGRRTA